MKTLGKESQSHEQNDQSSRASHDSASQSSASPARTSVSRREARRRMAATRTRNIFRIPLRKLRLALAPTQSVIIAAAAGSANRLDAGLFVRPRDRTDDHVA